jgi:hypothetical protein
MMLATSRMSTTANKCIIIITGAYVPLLVASAHLDEPEAPGRPPGKDKHPW